MTQTLQTPLAKTAFDIPAYGHLFRLRNDLSEMHKNMDRIIDNAIKMGASNLQLGPDVKRFEQALIDAWGPTTLGDAIAVSSGCSALHGLLEMLELPLGSEIVVPGNTFALSVTPMFHTLTKVNNRRVHAQLVPVFADINATGNLDPQRVREAIVPGKTQAILAVDLHGLMAPMFELRHIADFYGLLLIEDMSQAHGATMTGSDGRVHRAGSLADIAFASDNSLKPIGGFDADGGFILVSSAFLQKRPNYGKLLRAWRNAGRMNVNPVSQYSYDFVGYRSRMGNFQAWKSCYDLARLDQWNERRREIAAQFTAALQQSHSQIQPPFVPPDYDHIFWNYVVTCPTLSLKQNLLQTCWAAGIQATETYPYLPDEPAFLEVEHRVISGSYAAFIAQYGVHIPCYPELLPEHIARIVEVLRSV